MKIQDDFSISVEEYHVRIDVEVTQSMVPTQSGRPRWKLHYDEYWECDDYYCSTDQ